MVAQDPLAGKLENLFLRRPLLVRIRGVGGRKVDHLADTQSSRIDVWIRGQHSVRVEVTLERDAEY